MSRKINTDVLRTKLKSFWNSLLGKNVWFLFFLAGAVLILANVLADTRIDYSESAAKRLTRNIQKRFSVLERYMHDAVELSPDSWMTIKELPEDMVVYRYVGDSLQSWSNQFSLDNDDISNRLLIQRFVNLRYNLVSPLSEADTSVKYMSIGPKWYLVKAVTDDHGCRIIGGLEIRNTVDSRSVNGINPRLHLSDHFSVFPISYSGGAVISLEGYPLMKLVQETSRISPLLPDTTMIWLSAAFFIIGVMVYLGFHRNVRTMSYSIAAVTLALGILYAVGCSIQDSSALFSPTLYADGSIFQSLGALLIINIWITLIYACVYLTEKGNRQKVAVACSEGRAYAVLIGVIVADALTIAYMTWSFRSLILNSNINLELYNIAQLGRYSLYIYFSYMALAVAVALSFQIIRVPLFCLAGVKYDVFSRSGRITFAVLCASYFLSMFSILGTEKEYNRVQIWQNRLSVDRDLGLELQLRGIEEAIAADNAIPEVIESTQDYKIILNRISETYMRRISKDFDISIYIFKDNIADPQVRKYFNDRVLGAVPIAPDSRFVYSRTDNGMAQYTGMFVYWLPDKGSTKMLLGINSKSDRQERGYAFIMDEGTPGAVVIPPRYSYAKYIDGNLVSYKGDYPYPTVLSKEFSENLNEDGSNKLSLNSYLHYYKRVSPTESIIISRPRISIAQYVLALFMLCLVSYFLISALGLRKKRTGKFEKNYYKSRVNAVLFLSMLMTLVTMSLIMVLFVYRRNDANIMRLMNNKITTIQSLVENKTKPFQSYRELATPEIAGMLNDIGKFTRSDITLFSPDGKVFNTTAPEVYEKMILGSRTNPEAFRNIKYLHKRYYIHKESIAGRTFYTMYAPVVNDRGRLIAILSSPYTDSGLSFKSDALFHSVFVITIFFLLLLITRFLTTKVVDRMFRPITEMGKKMIYARTGGLEYIIYDNEDELSGLVRAYNLMVHDLSESSKQVAQAERERAWSEMARQVAHEIKNPLTPMKLQIQRLIRLKSKNDPTWESKFEDISRLMLDSIDVLTDTANEFSTFAKLYTEEMVPIDLDSMASDQISMFDDRDNITFQYFGLKNAMVKGPKPQLIRVFVNLLTNAVQAIENKQAEESESGQEVFHGQIVLSLRNSSKDGFYDIVVEDNGPGIKDENRSRLFTPNFTTKSSGTGLGLAICKNILERCGGEIFYSQSFSLRGACFTVRYPKNKD